MAKVIEVNAFKKNANDPQNRKSVSYSLFNSKTIKTLYFGVMIFAMISLVTKKDYFSIDGHEVRNNITYLFLIILVIYIVLAFLVRKNVAIRKSYFTQRLIFLIVLWWNVILISTLINPIIYPGLVLYFFNNLVNFLKWSSGIIFFLIGIKFIRWKESDLKIVFSLLLIVSVAISIIFLSKYNLFSRYSQLYRGFSKNMSWTFWREESIAKNELPEVFAMISIISFSIIPEYSGLFKKIFYFLLTLVIIVFMLFFFSRETYITFGIGLLALFIIKDMKKISRILLFSVFFLFSSVFIKLKFGEYILDTIREFRVNPARAVSFRIYRWDSAIKIGFTHPLIGVGFWNFQYFDPFKGTASHNAYLQSLVTGGIIGFIVYTIILMDLFLALKKCSKYGKHFIKAFSKGLLSVFIGYATSAFFADHFFTFYYFSIIFLGLFSILMAICEGRIYRQESEYENSISR